ncbi:hypothetical protein BOX15_Mlig020486g1, partial [Macrostomum lignano]
NGDAAYKNPQRQDEPAEAEGQTATAAAVAAGDSAGAATEATVEQPNGAAGSPTAGQRIPWIVSDCCLVCYSISRIPWDRELLLLSCNSIHGFMVFLKCSGINFSYSLLKIMMHVKQ